MRKIPVSLALVLLVAICAAAIIQRLDIAAAVAVAGLVLYILPDHFLLKLGEFFKIEKQTTDRR